MPNDTTQVFQDLQQQMMEVHTAVNPETNPVAKGLAALGAGALQHIVGQYSLFPARIVSFLYAARERAKASGWSAVAAELTRNIGEELGTETDGIAHYEMLLHGIADIAGAHLYADMKHLEASLATRAFLTRARHALGSADTAYALGATYALECSAVPELIIVRDILTRFLKETAARPIEGTLKAFFDMHLGTWEPGHEEGLANTLPQYLEQKHFAPFQNGFTEMMTAMDAWWEELDAEAGVRA